MCLSYKILPNVLLWESLVEALLGCRKSNFVILFPLSPCECNTWCLALDRGAYTPLGLKTHSHDTFNILLHYT